VADDTSASSFRRRAARFVAIGLVLYLAVYAAAEWLVYRHGHRNRFFAVRTAPLARYDAVILGASHAAVLDYQDINARLEELTNAKVLNLSVVGAGPVVGRLLLDYFLAGREAHAIVYVADSFAFHDAEWNERRLEDRQLYQRAPFDPALARLLLERPASRLAAVDYISGFSKINNPNRFRPEGEGEASRFERSYRPIPQIDRQRVDYLYPGGMDARALGARARYLSELEALILRARDAGSRTVVVRPPLPARFKRLLPGEADFDAALSNRVTRAGATLHDFSQLIPDDEFYFDSDHLNRRGVLLWIESGLGELVKAKGKR
jgi:hypothetical protein